MTKQQIARIASLTAYLAYNTYHDGQLAFEVKQLPTGSVLLTATNVYGDLRWFDKSVIRFVTIGPRGGIRRSSGSTLV